MTLRQSEIRTGQRRSAAARNDGVPGREQSVRSGFSRHADGQPVDVADAAAHEDEQRQSDVVGAGQRNDGTAEHDHLPGHISEWLLVDANRDRLDNRHVPDDHHCGGQYAGDHCDCDGEIAEKHPELVHCVAGGRRFLSRSGHNAVLAGQRADGLLDFRFGVVRHPFGGRCVAEHRVDYELVSDLAGPVLEHHEGGGVFAVANAGAGGGDDHGRVGDVGGDLHTAAVGLEGETTGGPAGPVSGEWMVDVRSSCSVRLCAIFCEFLRHTYFNYLAF